MILREKAPDSPLLSRRPALDMGAEPPPRLSDAAALQHAVQQVPRRPRRRLRFCMRALTGRRVQLVGWGADV